MENGLTVPFLTLQIGLITGVFFHRAPLADKAQGNQM